MDELVKVVLLNYTKNPDQICAAAAQSCYSEKGASELFEKTTDEKAKKIIKKVVGMGHLSTVEHAYFTFSIEGVSRSLTHQLVRHRVASYSQQSQRYVSMDKGEYVIPPSISSDLDSKRLYTKIMDETWKAYRELAKTVPKEDARYVLPNACHTNITVTMNARGLWHFFQLRCCRRAQWEIRMMAWKMLQEAKRAAPILFENAGPGCFRGPCPEGEYACGKPYKEGEIPTDDELIVESMKPQE
ncbi:FAD-dependent thymidylate synthase [Candidatus Bathyarchaeota archaeon RBG_16_57_9]|nr:MAG: FAD-dependent thymidylate synthase [Candidatus Bathyarchaeota archaeon RBG_16_57_9]